jgi:hypothetical protein
MRTIRRLWIALRAKPRHCEAFCDFAAPTKARRNDERVQEPLRSSISPAPVGGICRIAPARVPERGHRPALDQVHAILARGPLGESRPRELGAPAELARDRLEPVLDGPPQARFRADAADQDDLAAGLEHARELVERRLRIGNRGDHILRHHDVERVVRKGEALGIHDREALDIGEVEFDDPLLRLAQHRLGQVDADQRVRCA